MSVTSFYRVFVSVFAVIFLSACTFNNISQDTAQDTIYDVTRTIALSVTKVEVNDQYTPPLQYPNIEHTLINPPYRRAYNALQSMFRPQGAQDTLELNIIDASITQSNTQETYQNFRFWNNRHEREYFAQIQVQALLKSSQPPSTIKGQGAVSVTRTLKLSENASIAKREEALNRIVVEMVGDLQREMEKILDQKLLIVLR